MYLGGGGVVLAHGLTKYTCKNTPATIKNKKLLKINGETVAGMQEMTHRAHVFKSKPGGGAWGMPP